MTAASQACPATSDHDVIRTFIARTGAKHHDVREAMRRLLDGIADEADHERIVDFIDRNALIYDATCAALDRVLTEMVPA